MVYKYDKISFTMVGNIITHFKLMIKWQVMITRYASIVISRSGNRYIVKVS